MPHLLTMNGDYSNVLLLLFVLLYQNKYEFPLPDEKWSMSNWVTMNVPLKKISLEPGAVMKPDLWLYNFWITHGFPQQPALDIPNNTDKFQI